ncbi:MAG: metalloregulator ArsR/SmtB family transcription factor [Eubacteriales bacterium]
MLDQCDVICDGNHEHTTFAQLEKSLPTEQSTENLADFFKVFGDKTRIRILYLLKEQELCVCDLAECLNMTSPAVSHQLRILKMHRLVKSKRDGKSMFYSLDDHHIHGILADGMNHITEKYHRHSESNG